ncbi:hypothetical protein ATY36_13625 [Vibrio cidicii]|uniref:recombinase family protein n=1 Tax=Vibrio cidicii TaxID=1763883 RepID=UPI00078005A2|nr:recombinase family protein [Vibrio cidicii]KYN82223.1 hypothetical protein ATY36_13625 [Vibrio cidicii]
MKIGLLIDDPDRDMQAAAMAAQRCEKVSSSYDDLISDVKSGDVVVVWRMDKLAATVEQLAHRITEISLAGATVHFAFEGVDSSNTQVSQLIDIMKRLP